MKPLCCCCCLLPQLLPAASTTGDSSSDRDPYMGDSRTYLAAPADLMLPGGKAASGDAATAAGSVSLGVSLEEKDAVAADAIGQAPPEVSAALCVFVFRVCCLLASV